MLISLGKNKGIAAHFDRKGFWFNDKDDDSDLVWHTQVYFGITRQRKSLQITFLWFLFMFIYDLEKALKMKESAK